MSDGNLVYLYRTEPDLGHASQLSGDGARDVAGGEVGGRAPVFTHTHDYPDEGLEGGDLQPRGAAGGTTRKHNTDSNTSLLMHSPVYSSPPIN